MDLKPIGVAGETPYPPVLGKGYLNGISRVPGFYSQECFMMKRTLGFFMVFLMLSLAVSAEDLYMEPDEVYDLGVIVISNDQWKNVETIRSEEIRKGNLNDFQDLLSMVPGVNFSIGTKGEVSIFIRGLDKSKIKVIIDGVPVNDAYYDTTDTGMIPVHNIEKIEIYKGINAVSFGSNALGGVINIVTKRDPEGLTFNLQKGTFADRFSAEMTMGFGYFFASGSFNSVYSNGFKFGGKESENDMAFEDLLPGEDVLPNSSSVKNDLMLKTGFLFSAFDSIVFTMNLMNNKRDLPYHIYATKSETASRMFRDPRYWRFPVWDQDVFSLALNKLFMDRTKLTVTTAHLKIYNQLDMYIDREFTELGETDIFDDYVNSLNVIVEDVSWLNLKLGYIFEEKYHKKTADMFAYDDYEEEEFTSVFHNLFLMAEKTISFLTLNAQISSNKFIYDVSEWSDLNYYMKASGRFMGTLLAQVQYGHKTQFPALNRLADSFSAALEPEKSNEADISVTFNKGGLGLKLSYFANDVFDLIHRDDKSLPYYNIGKVAFSGFEAAVNWQFRIFSAGLSYEAIKGVNESEEGTYGSYMTDMPYIPVSKLGLRLGVKLFGMADLTYELYLAGKSYEYISDERIEVPSYSLSNVNINVDLAPVRVFMRINNLLDAFYYTEYGYPQPGREVVFGLEFAK